MTIPDVSDLKNQARRLRTALRSDQPQEPSHCDALELLAKQYGYRDWNTLRAAAVHRNPSPVSLGERVTGLYLGQPFSGEVVSVTKLPTASRYRVTIAFDAPVDVVTFESFSAFRRRVTSVIDDTGTSPAKTSNGQPQLLIGRPGR
ncbi:MAG: hypothetical protein JJ902_03390 [Roseibium sp.]|nr:hypothetical protein [Roseibium sp.]